MNDAPKTLSKKEAQKIISKAKGRRLQRVRNLAGWNRKELVEKAAINLNTLRGWETGLATGLSKKGAQRILQAVETEGVICRYEWLMNGVGPGPRVIDVMELNSEDEIHPVVTKPISQAAEEKQIIKELEFFRIGNKDSIELIVSDDGLAPFYKIGDYVAGIKRYGKQIKTLLDQDCIVQTQSGNILLRKFKAGSEKDRYNLVCTNTDTSVKEPVQYNVTLTAAAPVIWIRRREI